MPAILCYSKNKTKKKTTKPNPNPKQKTKQKKQNHKDILQSMDCQFSLC